ncbi:MAG: hypothetical protein KDI04_03495 [Halieaceae bacterium]|nr:hypothetical protein [Halieaceae bacterium]
MTQKTLRLLICLAAAASAQADTACPGAQLAAPAGCELGYGDIRFALQASAGGSINQLRIQPAGLAVDNSEISTELDGTAYRAEIADLDSNGWPEVYVFVSSAGSGSYGSLAAYAVNNGKSITPIYLPPPEQSPRDFQGYMGHDRFAVEGDQLMRRFPVYRPTDSNATPTGGSRELRYRLVPGEAGWVLQLVP